MRRAKLLRKGVVVIAIIALGWGVYAGSKLMMQMAQDSSSGVSGEVPSSTIREIREVIRLNTLEVVKTIPIHAKWEDQEAFGLCRYRAYITFDLDQLKTYMKGDTVVAVLPPEKIEIYEDEAFGTKIIDVWGTTFRSRLSGTGSGLSVERENEMRKMGVVSVRGALYAEGYVDRAREEALHRCSQLLSMVPGTVIVVDAKSRLDYERPKLSPHVEQMPQLTPGVKGKDSN